MGAVFNAESPNGSRSGIGLILVPLLGWVWLLVLLVGYILGFSVRRHHFESAGIAFGIGFVVYAVLLLRRSAPAAQTRTSPSSVSLTVTVAPVIAAFIAFGWSVGLGPLSDDFVLREWAQAGDWTPTVWPYLRPLPFALWDITTTLGGGWAALHALNIVLHAINSALVANLANGWVGSRAGVAAGLLFALFPAGSEAVAWTAGVFDLTSTCFVLLSVHIWINWEPSRWRTIAVVSCCLAGVMCKESAIVTPAVLLLISVLVAQHRPRQLRLDALPLVLTMCLMCVLLLGRAMLSSSLASHLDNIPVDSRGFKDLIVRPFAALAVPFRSDAGVTVVATIAVLVVLLAFGWMILCTWRDRTGREAEMCGSSQLSASLLGVGWIVLTSLPLLLQFFVSPTLEGSRYLYLPSVGFVLSVSAIICSSRKWPLFPTAAVALLVTVYATALHSERTVWYEAAATRDLLTRQAAEMVRGIPCRGLDILDPPDNVKGAFVFRVGLVQALSSLPLDERGEQCLAQWKDSELIRLSKTGPT